MPSGIGCILYAATGSSNRVRLADGSPGEDPLAPVVLSDLKVTWGRETTVDQPSAASCTFTMLDPQGGESFLDLIGLGTVVTVEAPYVTTTGTLTGTVFQGRVTAIKSNWDDSAGAPIASVTAVDFSADLENTIVGDTPWPVQSVADRFAAIIARTPAPRVSYQIAPSLSGTLVSWRDVDAQGAMGLLTEIGSSVDGVLWPQLDDTKTTGALYLEDPSRRASAFVLSLDTATNTVIVVANEADFDALELSACDVLRDGVEWVQDVQDVTTRVSVTWKVQGIDDDGKTTTSDRTVTVVDDDLETTYGQRSLSLSSQLQAESDASSVASKILARTTGTDWRATGLTIDDYLNDSDGDDGGGALPETVTNYVLDPTAVQGFNWQGSPDPTLSPYGRTGDNCYSFPAAAPTVAIAVTVPDGATTMTCSGWFRQLGGATGTYQLRIAGPGAVRVDSPVYANTAAAYEFRDLSTTVTPGGTVYFYPAYSITQTSQLLVDDLGVVFGPGPDFPAPVDFNGDTPDTDEYDYAWTGVPYASPSTRTTRGSGDSYLQLMLALLDVNARPALPIRLTDMPDWSITQDTNVYLEGGDYSFVNGTWMLGLTVSNPTALGTSAAWEELPTTWTWRMFDSDLSWQDLYGVAAPTTAI